MKFSLNTLSVIIATGLFSSSSPQDAASKQIPTKDVEHAGGLESITAKELKAHVDFLASDELKGRGAKTPEAKRAAEYLAERFKQYGLEPMGDKKSYFQAVQGFSPNVVGVVRGTGSDFVIVSAHYDHLAPLAEGEDRIFNGADDNASGTAAVLELAQAFGAQKERQSASIVFIGFTAEEEGLRGSRYFVAHAPMALESIRGVFNMDMISRGKKNLIFCEGGDEAPLLLETVKNANQRIKLDVRYGQHPEWLAQSDQYSFIQKGVAALYFGVEDHVDYHQVSDHADKILPELAAKVAQMVYLAATELSSME